MHCANLVAQISSCTWKPWCYIFSRSVFSFFFLSTPDYILAPFVIPEHLFHNSCNHVSHNSFVASNIEKSIFYFSLTIQQKRDLLLIVFILFFWRKFNSSRKNRFWTKNGQFIIQENIRPIFCNFWVRQMKILLLN